MRPPASKKAIGQPDGPIYLRVPLSLAAVVFAFLGTSLAQTVPTERTFLQARPVVEKALKDLRSSGHLPILDGFAVPRDRAFEHFERGYYQCEVKVSSTDSGGSLVRVSAHITAWYSDPAPAKSGYQVLASNGRLEADFLDQLEERLNPKPSPSRGAQAGTKAESAVSTISAPPPNVSVLSDAISASKTTSVTSPTAPLKAGGVTSQEQVASLQTQKAVADRHMQELETEARNLEEILRTQAQPNNLAAVRKSGTPVLVSPAEGAKVLFSATEGDEFEILDMNAAWVHVRISGLSRGWILRSSVELPDSSAANVSADTPGSKKTSAESTAKTDPFQVSGEQIASFPGDWAPLRGKTVKIISVQESGGKSPNTSAPAKLEFAKSLLAKAYAELSQDPQAPAGVVVIFDAEDGGMMAAILPVLQEWKDGKLSDAALWRRCFFDPPEMSGSSGP